MDIIAVPDLIKKLTTARNILAQQGLVGLTNTLLKKVFPSGNYFLSWDTRILLECPTSKLARLKPNPEFTAKILSASEARLLVGVNNQSLKSIEAAINRHEVCWTISEKDNLLSYVWISKNRAPVCSDTAFILPNIGLNYWWRDIYVAPEYRGTGKISQHLQSWFQSLTDSESSSLYCEIAPENMPSIISHQRNGFIIKGKLRMLCIFGIRVFFFSTSETSKFSFRFYPKNIYYS